MANLVIDIGNTYTKVAVFERDELKYVEQYQQAGASILEDISDYTISKAIISSVKKNNEKWETVLEGIGPLIYFNADMTTGIINHYLTPKTLGLDRLASVIGAAYLYPGKSSLVIDGGTCIKYDHIDVKANYFGGSISPGLNTRYKALNHYTAGLPLVNRDETFSADYGNDTRSAILSGVQNGIKHELTGFIENYRKNEPELNIILSGGDSIFFDTLLKNSIFAPYIKIEPYLVLKGLNAAIPKNND